MAKGKKTGGRQPGSPNRKTQSLLEICEREGVDFFGALVKIAKDPSHERHFDAVKEGCQYLYPKRKAVEVSGSLDVHLQQELERLMKLPEDELMAMLKEIYPK